MAWVVTAVEAAYSVFTVAIAAGETMAAIGAAATIATDVGLTMSIAGLATGNKKLSEWGGDLTLVGGVGSLATSAISSLAANAASTDVIGKAALDGTTDFGSSAAANAYVPDVGKAALDGTTDFGSSAASNAYNTGSYSGASPVADAGGINSSLQANAVAEGKNTVGILDSAGGDSLPSGHVSSNVPSTTPQATTLPGDVTPSTPASGNAPPVVVDNGAIAPVSDGTLTNPNGNRINNVSAYDASNTISQAKTSGLFDSAKQWFSGLKDTTQAEILKAAMAVPGGIQAQSNKARELAIMKQRADQTSYGSVPNYFGAGIIANAQQHKV